MIVEIIAEELFMLLVELIINKYDVELEELLIKRGWEDRTISYSCFSGVSQRLEMMYNGVYPKWFDSYFEGREYTNEGFNAMEDTILKELQELCK